MSSPPLLNGVGTQFGDYQSVWSSVGRNTVDRLKAIINLLNARIYAGLPKSGKKQDHIDRIRTVLNDLVNKGDASKWQAARAVIMGEPIPSTSTAGPSTTTTSSSYHGSAATTSAQPSYSAANSSSSWRTQPSTVNAPALPGTKPTIRFKASPFYAVDRAVSDVVSGNEVRSSNERGTASTTFFLDDSDRAKVTSGDLQVRLYATSSHFHTTPFHSASWASQICPIEFPPVIEIKVNGEIIQGANTRGIKKKPGTAPPANISKPIRNGSNRLEMTFINNTQPFVLKRWYFVVNLVKPTSVSTLVQRLRANRSHSAESVKNKLWKSSTDDDDIQVGAQTLSMKCPLSYVRIATPCRSQNCGHGQCFDALSWYTMMEQTTTYICPVCDKTLQPEELIMDGFFDSILETTDESVEEVIVEPDAEWHTADNKFHSGGWRPPLSKSKHSQPSHPAHQPSVSGATSVPAQASRSSESKTPSQHIGDGARSSTSHVLIIDSDDDDDITPTATLQSRSTTSAASLVGVGSKRKVDQVIDLTISSDEDEPPARRPPPPQSTRAASGTPNLPRRLPGSFPSDPKRRVSSPVDSGGSVNAGASWSGQRINGSGYGGRWESGSNAQSASSSSGSHRPNSPLSSAREPSIDRHERSPYETPAYSSNNATFVSWFPRTNIRNEHHPFVPYHPRRASANPYLPPQSSTPASSSSSSPAFGISQPLQFIASPYNSERQLPPVMHPSRTTISRHERPSSSLSSSSSLPSRPRTPSLMYPGASPRHNPK